VLALALGGSAAHAQDSRGSRDADGPIPQLVNFIGNILPKSPQARERATPAARQPRVVQREQRIPRESRAVALQQAVAAPLPPRRLDVLEAVVHVTRGQELEPSVDAVSPEGRGIFGKLLPFRLGEGIEQRLEVAIADGPLPPRRPNALRVAMASSEPELAQREDSPRQDLNLFARILPDAAPEAPGRPANERQVPLPPEGPPPRRPLSQKVAAVPREPDPAPRDDVAPRSRDPLTSLFSGNPANAGVRPAEPGEPGRQAREARPSRLLPAEIAMMAQRNAYAALIAKHANEHGVPLVLADAVVRIESRYNPRARNGPNHGLTQINYDTAKSLGYGGTVEGLYDADTNLRYGMRYLGMAYRLANGDTCGTILKYQGGHQAQYMTNAANTYCARARAIIAAAR
jgi:soluble lytic murein transglycosylase-like protein